MYIRTRVLKCSRQKTYFKIVQTCVSMHRKNNTIKKLAFINDSCQNTNMSGNCHRVDQVCSNSYQDQKSILEKNREDLLVFKTFLRIALQVIFQF